MNLTAVVAAQIHERFPPCPMCSHYRADHSVLIKDVVIRPSAIQSRRTGRWLLIDMCPHAKPFFGPHETEDAASTLWKAEVEKLTAQKQQQREALAAATAQPINPVECS
jgi:hypothetical protein